VPERGYELELVPRVPLPRRPTPELVRLPGRLTAAVNACAAVLDRVGADVVVGFGGYVSAPAYLAARRRRIPLVVHEANARAGFANRLGARLTRSVAVTFPGTALPNAVRTGSACGARSRPSTVRPRARQPCRVRPRAGPYDAAGVRRLAGRPATEPDLPGRGAGSGCRRRPGAPRQRARQGVPLTRPATATRPMSSSRTSTASTWPTPRPMRSPAGPGAGRSARSPRSACRRRTSRCRSATASRRSTPVPVVTAVVGCSSTTRAARPIG
jgi:hypothetical protein